MRYKRIPSTHSFTQVKNRWRINSVTVESASLFPRYLAEFPSKIDLFAQQG